MTAALVVRMCTLVVGLSLLCRPAALASVQLARSFARALVAISFLPVVPPCALSRDEQKAFLFAQLAVLILLRCS